MVGASVPAIVSAFWPSAAGWKPDEDGNVPIAVVGESSAGLRSAVPQAAQKAAPTATLAAQFGQPIGDVVEGSRAGLPPDYVTWVPPPVSFSTPAPDDMVVAQPERSIKLGCGCGPLAPCARSLENRPER